MRGLACVTSVLLVLPLQAVSAQSPAESEMRVRIAKAPDDLEAYFDLVRLCVSQGRFSDVEPVLASISKAMLRAEAARMPGLNEAVEVVVQGRPATNTPSAAGTDGPRIAQARDTRSFVDMSDIVPPKKMSSADPLYPTAARTDGIQGTVIIQGVVDHDGRVSDARVVKGFTALNDAALAAVQKWRYRAALVKGEPKAVVLTVSVTFRLASR